MKYFFLLLMSFVCLNCNTQDKTEKEIRSIPMEVKIVRFDKEFAATRESTLLELKAKYPVFFPKQFNDSIWIQKLNDTLQQELNSEVERKFPSNEKLEEELLSIFQHIKYYFPRFNSPTVVTTTSDVDYNNKIILSDSLLIISLDTYLGSDHRFYGGIKNYIAQNLTESQMGPDIVAAYAHQIIAKPSQRTFMAHMVFFGKELYLKDVLLPNLSDAEKIGYTEEQLKWAHENESEMWRYFVEKELLYSTSEKLLTQFINPAPFSKFYLEIDNESPGMIGRYLGWQIVRSYMNTTNDTMNDLLNLDSDDLFKKSKYKPSK